MIVDLQKPRNIQEWSELIWTLKKCNVEIDDRTEDQLLNYLADIDDKYVKRAILSGGRFVYNHARIDKKINFIQQYLEYCPFFKNIGIITSKRRFKKWKAALPDRNVKLFNDNTKYEGIHELYIYDHIAKRRIHGAPCIFGYSRIYLTDDPCIISTSNEIDFFTRLFPEFAYFGKRQRLDTRLLNSKLLLG